ncbi:hypothetical protein R1flu_015662 [Riccia fluitans]|uniref:Uncharacterized protein n=1 Tax=Riccia fluitans TaxID=41844 RepID=A0ABD1YJK6_9MARC
MLVEEARCFNQAIMDGSLPPMDVHMPQIFHQDQSNEEMKQLLLCARLELQSVKAEERAHEAKLRHHEAQLRHLQDALFKVRKERDEYRDKCNQLQARLSRSPSRGSGMSDPNLSNVQQQQQQQMESVSSMAEPTRATLSEVHRHLQEQQQMEFPHMEIQKHLHHQLDLPNHHHMVVDLDLQQENDHQISAQQLEQLQQQLEIQQQQQEDQTHEQLGIDIRNSPDRQSGSSQCGDDRNNSTNNNKNSSSTSWSMQIKMRGSADQTCSLMDESLRIQMELSQGTAGVSGSHHLDQHSAASLDDFHDHLQQEQQMHMHLQLQQQQREESELLLAHMQQRNVSTSHMHIGSDDQQQQAAAASSCQSRMTEGQDVVMSVLQHSGWQRTPPPQSCSSVMQIALSPSVDMGTVSVSSFSMSSPPVPGAGAASSFSMSSPAVSSYSRSSPGVQSGHHQAPPPPPPQLLQNRSAVASILSPLERYADSQSNCSLLAPGPLHLPEPPEANAQVILSTLPEKGKLLQAVMQAGPLLQTLMVAGPLPQWRHPPPAMDSLEIPRVPMSAPTLPVGCSIEHSSPGNVMARNGVSSNMGHVMRMSSSLHNNSSSMMPNGGLCHTKTMPASALSSIATGFDTFSSPLNPSLNSQRSLPQRLPLSNSHLSHDMSLLGPPMKYAKIH